MKQPSRKVVRAKQQHIARLQRMASLEPYLPRRRVIGLSPSGAIRTERVKDPWEGEVTIGLSSDGRPVVKVKRVEPKSAQEAVEWHEAQRKQFQAMAYPAALLVTAPFKLKEEYRVAVEESLAGIEAGDLRPLQQHLSMIGPTLLVEPQIIRHVHDWWLGAKWGDRVSAQHLKAVLKMLAPGGGRLGERSYKEKQEAGTKRKQDYDKRIRSTKDEIRKLWVTAREKLSRASRTDPKVLQQLATSLLRPYLTARERYKQVAAGQMQDEISKQIRQVSQEKK